MQTPTDGVSTPKTKSLLRSSSAPYLSSRYPLGSLHSVRRRSSYRLPSKRRVPQNTPIQDTLDPQKAALLLQKQWTLYSVTPMYNFSYDKLKEYSKHLSATIAAEKQKGVAIDPGSDLNLKASFSCLPGLKGKERDPTAVLVQITGKSQLSKPGTEERIVWTGWFCGTFTEDDILEVLPETFTCLPLFLINGSESFTAIVGTWFQQVFDCCFAKLVIRSHDLRWLAAMCAGYEVHGHVPTTELVFSVPVEPHMDISFAIHPEDFKTLWHDIQKSKDEVTVEEVEHLFQCLYAHFFRHFKIHLSATQLVKVTVTVASAHCDGKVKVSVLSRVLGQ
ncbi:PREDICTED: centromere protein L [Nanorana parkeri]|uniref:centromere protein L n=1 Tax=Nanorana parkeri TaxID=125878 RepID=UPI000854A4BF|nr:PREDICTED: centromere protein L [Nanorana parkeri]